MMESLMNLPREIWSLVNEMSPYLLLGFLLAGLMHEFIPSGWYHKYLSGKNMRSVVLAALFGVPLPLCSCGVIPTAMGLRREGGSRGATVSFLIATPQTGVDSIIATYSLMGLPFALIRPVVAMITAIFGGFMVNLSDDEMVAVMDSHVQKEHHEHHEGLMHRLSEAVGYALCEMMEDIGKWLVVGLVIAGIITALVPDAWFAAFQDNSVLSILFVLLFSIPMYLCATGSIPIAVALMLKGLTPGAALVLLMAGPASNAASIMVIGKVLGRKTMVAYLVSIITGAVVFGLGIDYLLPSEWFTSALQLTHDHCCETPGWFSVTCTVILGALLVNALTPLKFWKGHECHCHDHNEAEHCHCHDEKCECHCHEDECHCHEDETMEFSITGMHCHHCEANALRAIESVGGVEHATVSLEEKKAVVRGEFDPADIIKAVESLGFGIEKI